MSIESQPIASAQFAMAIQDLPVENLYAKAAEIENSIQHLERSNKQLQEYSDSIRDDTSVDTETRRDGDQDCLEAIHENVVVIERQKERIDLLRLEAKRRGLRWGGHDETGETLNGTTAALGNTPAPATGTNGSTSRPQLSDDELRRQMEERVGAPTGSHDEEGMYL